MKKFRIYLILLVLVPAVAIGALFFIPGPDGQPLLNRERLKRSLDWDWAPIEKAKQLFNTPTKTADTAQSEDSPQDKAKGTTRFDAPVEAPPETLFKWRDKEGNWHYSNQIPPDNVEFEIVKDQ